MKIELKYYKLSDDKRMGDGNIIPQNQELILIREEGGMFFLETKEDSEKRMFWAKKDEVNFIKISIEDWENDKIIKRNKQINGEFL